MKKQAKKTQKAPFMIKHFDDYHEIRSNTHKTIELGCFPTKDYGYFRYFGLFYKSAKPTYEQVLQSIKSKVKFGEFVHYRGDGEDIGIQFDDEFKKEIKSALRSSPYMPGE